MITRVVLALLVLVLLWVSGVVCPVKTAPGCYRTVTVMGARVLVYRIGGVA